MEFETETISRQEQKPSEMQTAVDQELLCGVIGFEVSGWRLYIYIVLGFIGLFIYYIPTKPTTSGIRNHIPPGAEAQRDADSRGSGFGLWGHR